MKKSILFLVLAMQFVSCKQIIKDFLDRTIEESRYENISDSNFIRVEIDSLYALSMPKYMKVMNNLYDQASLQYGNAYKDAYTIVVSDDKQDFIDYFKEIGEYKDNLSVIENYSKSQIKHIKKEIKGVKIIPYGLEELNNYRARQYKLVGKADTIDIAYIIAFIETKGDLFMIMNWTQKNRLSRFENTFEIITDSFEYLLNTKNIDEIP